ncbi:MAG TPA: FHA domain-containing protein [Solirubrobacteraceae bacterium]|nr:FHA domain-containing protein [Solirubrobacteraceae bacterium]
MTTTLQPVSVALKFGFIAVLYLFLLWVSRSALRDLRVARPDRFSAPIDGTGLHSASTGIVAQGPRVAPRLVVERAPGHTPGMIYDIDDGAVLGRGDAAEIRLQDPFASSRHARILTQAGAIVLEDLGSTNGTYLNEELLEGPAPLHPGDRVRIGDSEFTYEEG